jgi:hypothetical protein
MTVIDLDTAIYNPASVFKEPDEIMQDAKITLTREQKLLALKTWKYDIQLRRIAEEENMHSESDEEDVRLEEKILKLLHILEPVKAS